MWYSCNIFRAIKWSRTWCTCRCTNVQILSESVRGCRCKYVQKNNIKMNFREVVYDRTSGALKSENFLRNWVTTSCLTRSLYALACYCSTSVICTCCFPLYIVCQSHQWFPLCADYFPRLLMVALQGSLVCHVCSLWIWWRRDSRINRLDQMASASTILCEFVPVVRFKEIL